jgi:hypothetical protein
VADNNYPEEGGDIDSQEVVGGTDEMEVVDGMLVEEVGGYRCYLLVDELVGVVLE